MNSRPVLASLLCASLASFAPGVSHAQLPTAGVSAVMASMARLDAEPTVTSVLGLRSEDKKAGERLTSSLREAFAEREMTGGQELTLEEVILTLDCASEEDTACMTEAGRALETEKLVYGSLAKSGGSYVVDIIVLDVTTGQVEAQGTLPFDSDALSAGNVDATATEVVNSLYPQADTSVIATAPTAASNDTADETTDGSEPGNDSDYVWGPYKPRPTWKKVGLGISVGVMVAGIVTGAIGGGLSQFYYPDRVTRESDKANADGGTFNNTTVQSEDEVRELLRAGKDAEDPCDVSLLPATIRNPTEEKSNAVVNKGVADLCFDGRNAATVGTIGWIGAGVGAAATIVFSVLYFVHKDKGPKSSARRPARRSFRLTGGPTEGGIMLGGVGRF